MVLFRLIGKRGLAAMNTFDFIVIFLLSNVVQNAVIGSDNEDSSVHLAGTSDHVLEFAYVGYS